VSTDLVKSDGRGGATRPPIGLLLSIGDTTTSRGGKEIPTRIDYFRPKEGQLTQYAAAVAKFNDVYGPEPKQLDDVYFLSNNIGDILTIRLMAWGSSGPRLVGDTNFATLPPDEWEERANAFDDDITYYPLSPADVKPEIRDTWNGEPIRGRLSGPKDPSIKKLAINIECTLNFCLPEVMGFGTVAQITTKGRRSTRNLVSAINNQHQAFHGQLVGIPFRLSNRPARGRHFDPKDRTYKMTTFPEIVLDTPFTQRELLDAIRERREALGVGIEQPALGSAEGRAFTEALALPAGAATDGEDVQLRDEPSAVDRVDDALLNRIAQLQEQVGDGAMITLRGVFGVEDPRELDPAAAAQYEQILTRSIEAEPVEDAEIVDDDDDTGIVFGEPRA
jgi:hypothetical protein